MSRPQGLVGTVGGSSAFGGSRPPGLAQPTTTGLSLGLSVGGTVDLYAFDVLVSPGAYSDFEISFSPSSGFAAQLQLTCSHVPSVTVYLRGTTPSISNSIPALIEVVDSFGVC